MMEKEKHELLKDSLQIMMKYSNVNDAKVLSLLLRELDKEHMDEDTFNELVHNYFINNTNEEGIKKVLERGTR